GARRVGRAAGGGADVRQRVDAEPEHGDAERVEQLGRGRAVEERFRARRDDECGSPRELREIGRDVRRIREAAMDAADAAGGEDADAGRARRRERARDRGGAEGPLDGRGREVARPDLARLRAEPGELLSRQPYPNLAVEDSD